MWLQLRNQGHAGDRGHPRGNLKIRVVVKEHPTFERRHRDLFCRVVLDEFAMSEGAEIKIATLEGSELLRVPQGTLSGDQLRMRGLGMPDIGGGRRGDIIVEVLTETAGE
jgi:molecular chaperone DnaJ